MKKTFQMALCLIAAFALASSAFAAPARVAILGDSITYGGRWATMVESALRATPQFANAEIVNFGLSSETVSGLSEPNHAGGKFPRPCLHERLSRILSDFKPMLVLACYGMNDGIYLPPDPARMRAFQDGILKFKSEVEQQGGKVIFITAPLHNADKPSDDPQRYDAVLDAQAAWLNSQRGSGWLVVDIRPDLKSGVTAAKSVDSGFVYAKDGIHLGEQGHALIAESVCRQLWPLLKLTGSPEIAGPDALAILSRRSELLKLAWLGKTKHVRPGVPAGFPLGQAEVEAARLLKDYELAAKTASASTKK